jgi:hypothetical protein
MQAADRMSAADVWVVYTLVKTYGQSESSYAEAVRAIDHRNLDVE